MVSDEFGDEGRLLSFLLRCWGKTGDATEEFHPALFHMLDVGHVARELMTERASPRFRNVLSAVLGVDAEAMVQLVPWVVALHDIGKLSVAFQTTREDQAERLRAAGLPFGEWRQSLNLHHSVMGGAFLADELPSCPVHWLTDIIVQLCVEMANGHHGRFADAQALKRARNSARAYEPPEWRKLRAIAVKVIAEIMATGCLLECPRPTNISAATAAITGFAILCDWIGSDSTYFRPRPEVSVSSYCLESARRAQRAVEAAGFLRTTASPAPVSFSHLFHDIESPRPLQKAVDDIPAELLSRPCFAIIEAPTGEGKTEAALALAHRLAAATGTDELYYALPTTATSNQMFCRVQNHLQRRLGLGTQAKLVHGQAFLVEDSLRISPLGDADNRDHSVEWFASKKRALLAPFGVGTVDQVELAALNARHAVLRLLGLAGKVVILDEVHAYDTYMTTIIERLLTWLSQLGSSVILLSATLPLSRKRALARAYGLSVDGTTEQQVAYPALWVANADEYYCCCCPPAQQPRRQIVVSRLHFTDAEADARARWLLDTVRDGGCACWITNTVERAQKMFQALDGVAPPDVDRLLLHGRFPLENRQTLEGAVTNKYGPGGIRPRKGIVIGTQVLEQSLDLDFDVMVSDLAPVDLLLQRAGRLHRHSSHDPRRPAVHKIPRLWINSELDREGNLHTGVDGEIYPDYFLLQTYEVLRERAVIELPADYRTLVEAVYEPTAPVPDTRIASALQRLEKQQAKATDEAYLRLLPEPYPEWPFSRASGIVFEEREDSAAWIVAQTRLGSETVTVIPLERRGNKGLCPGSEEELPLDEPATYELQLRLLRRSLRIGHRAAVAALKKASGGELPALFAGSPLLKGCIPLWLEAGQTTVAGPSGPLTLTLDPRLGMVITKERS